MQSSPAIVFPFLLVVSFTPGVYIVPITLESE